MGFQIAIDGPAGSGKSTIGKILAKQMNFVYLDTGAMYRCYALKMSNMKTDYNSDLEVKKILEKTDILIDEKGQIFLDNKEVSAYIRTPEISKLSSVISMNPIIRRVAVDLQRKIASDRNVIMDGRDIGTVVLPKAQLKIYLVASVEERTKRRIKELQQAGYSEIDYAESQRQIKERDERDFTRKESPLKKADDAIEINTDNLTIEQVCETIKKMYNDRIRGH
jgi:cytidylate kinase